MQDQTRLAGRLVTLGELHDAIFRWAISHYCPEVTFGVRGIQLAFRRKLSWERSLKAL
ncbi:MAG: hypothetical protein HOB79_04000 [Rhodospirillaceae bacterium]|jgi:hypothetical protein|nr:hypothetical protein [Rhodospirillaceae bacterium]